MSIAIYDRVLETTTTSGTGTLTLLGANLGYQSFNSTVDIGNQTYYVVNDGITGAWEIGLGTLLTSNTLSRTTVIASSNANALVNLAASNTKNVFIDVPAAYRLTAETPIISYGVGSPNADNSEYIKIWYDTTPIWRITSAQSGTGVVRSLQIDNGSPSVVPLIVAGQASQTANLQEWHNSSGDILASIDHYGDLRCGNITGNFFGSSFNILNFNGSAYSWGTSYANIFSSNISIPSGSAISLDNNSHNWLFNWNSSGQLMLAPSNGGTAIVYMAGNGAYGIAAFGVAGSVIGSPPGGFQNNAGDIPANQILTVFCNGAGNEGVVVQLSASATANAINVLNHSAASVFSVSAIGNLTSSGGAVVSPALTSSVGLIVKGLASQTANLQEWQNSSGTVLTQIESDGTITLVGNARLFGGGSQLGIQIAGGNQWYLSQTQISNNVGVVGISGDLQISSGLTLSYSSSTGVLNGCDTFNIQAKCEFLGGGYILAGNLFRFGNANTGNSVFGAMDTSGFWVGSTQIIGFSSDTFGSNWTNAAPDVGLSRLGAGIMQIGDGGANANGILHLAYLNVSGAVANGGSPVYFSSGLLVYGNPLTIAETQASNTGVDGLILLDSTAATSGNQQWSPRIRFSGQGWETSTPASQQVDFIIENQTVQGSSNPTGNLVISSQVNGAGFTQWASLGYWLGPANGAIMTFSNSIGSSYSGGFGACNDGAAVFSGGNQVMAGLYVVSGYPQMHVGPSGTWGWAASFSSGLDTQLSRYSAGIVQIGGTTKDASGSLLLTNLTASGVVSAITGINVSTVFSVDVNGNTTIEANLITPVVAPTTLSSDQDNYSLGTGRLYEMESSTDVNISGLVADVSGREVFITNIGSNNIILNHESTSSLAINRIHSSSEADITILPDEGIFIFYSPSISRWRAYP